MKLKTTTKFLKERFGTKYALQVGYCDLWHLLKGAEIEPFAYTCGTYGWNFDAYEYKGFLITTGYRGMFGKDAQNCRKYEEKARKLFEKYGFQDRKKRKTACLKLLDKFIQENFEQ